MASYITTVLDMGFFAKDKINRETSVNKEFYKAMMAQMEVGLDAILAANNFNLLQLFKEMAVK